ncbi:hypothetical protein [Marinoscillum sp.]|uniref:hypothetical protein n=1 Tax=Marinoscillum sp. TaxID=2024838 RepID=UPI003BAA3A90
MKARLLVFLAVSLLHHSVFCQLMPDRKAIKVLLETNDQEQLRGYLADITEDSVTLFFPENGYDSTLSYEAINRIVLLQKSSFLTGLIKGFVFSETLIVFTTLGENDSYFGPWFFFVLGNFLIVAPTSLLTGLVAMTPSLYIDTTSPTNILKLRKTRFNKFFVQSDSIRITEKGIARLHRLSFSKDLEKPSRQLGYSPRFYLQPFEPGIWWTSIGDQIIENYQSQFPEVSQDRRGQIESSFGVGYSPNSHWEVGYQLTSSFYGGSSLAYYDTNVSHSVNYNYEFVMHSVYLLRRFSPYLHGVSDNWQFNAGVAISQMTPDLYTYIYAGDDMNGSYEERNSKQSLFGLGVIGSIDHYVSKSFSFCLRFQNSWFTSMRIDDYSNQEFGLSWNESTINPRTTSLSLGMRLQF